MSCILIRIGVGMFCCATFALSLTSADAQNNESQKTLRQTRADVAALPGAGGQPTNGFAASSVNSNSTNSFSSSAHRQTSSPADVYNYPAGPPRLGSPSVGYRMARNNENALLANQLSSNSGSTTGNLGSRAQSYQPQINSRPSVYNINPGAAVENRTARNTTTSRSPVEQQVSSTLPIRQNVMRQALGNNGGSAVDPTNSVSIAQQAQAQAVQLAQQAQTQQAQAAQTLAQAQQAQSLALQLAQATQPGVRQTVFQQSTLGLGGPQFRTAQNCTCAPAYTQRYSPQAYNPASAAYQAPTLNPNVGTGLGLNGQNFQPQAAAGFAQPNYQLPAGFGTPQFGAQGARWWTPFVSGSGVYPPLLKLQNMPVGTYLGQGIIGQPTAYVDGQPVRNLLRYVSP